VYPHCAGDSCMETFGSPSDRLTAATGGTGDCCLERPSSSSDEYIRRLAGRRIGEVTSGDRDTCWTGTGRGEDGGVDDRRLADALRVGEVEWSEMNDMCCTDEEDNDGVGDRGLHVGEVDGERASDDAGDTCCTGGGDCDRRLAGTVRTRRRTLPGLRAGDAGDSCSGRPLGEVDAGEDTRCTGDSDRLRSRRRRAAAAAG